MNADMDEGPGRKRAALVRGLPAETTRAGKGMAAEGHLGRWTHVSKLSGQEKVKIVTLALYVNIKNRPLYDQPLIAADALYRAGLSYQKQAATAEYDQSMAGKSIATYTDFMTFYPDDKRVPEVEKSIALMKQEQVRGNYKIAQYYEKTKRWAGAVVYYNEVLQLDPNSQFAGPARERIQALKPKLQTGLN